MFWPAQEVIKMLSKANKTKRRVLGVVESIHTVVAGSFLQSVHVCGGQAGPGVVGWGEGETIGWIEG